jgi:hypothetical protein
MRSRVLALILAGVALILIPVVAEAGHRRHHHSGYNHRGYAESHEPFYHRHYRSDRYYDPYAYYPARRAYYPYYNSGHWRPTHELRYRRDCCRPVATLPPYYRAWGYPTKRYYKHRKWRRHW